MKRTFDEWLGTFRTTIADYKYYVDFEKVYANVDGIKVKLNILNSLIGADNIEHAFGELLSVYPEILTVVPILLAKREAEIVAMDETLSRTFDFTKPNCNTDDYIYFMRATGLFDLLQHHIISNLVDYVTGVEAGMDTNGRKNRGGHLMENLVERYILKAGYIKGVSYFKEMRTPDVERLGYIDLSPLSNHGKTVKRFDFVIHTGERIFAIETNFYTSGGSKLNETARSYKTLALEARHIDRFTFVWITDGQGWLSARNNLEETFDVLSSLYNISDLESGILERLM